MILQDAYLKAKDEAERQGLTIFSSCRDYGKFWGFHFWPTGHDPNRVSGGGSDITVNKKTGAMGEFVPTMDLDLLDKAIPIPIDQFIEYNVAV